MDITTIAAMQLDAMRNRRPTVNANPETRFGIFRELLRVILDSKSGDDVERNMELRALLSAADQHEAEMSV